MPSSIGGSPPGPCDGAAGRRRFCTPRHAAAVRDAGRVRAVKYTADGISVVEVAEPEGDGVVVEPVAVGICGSDLHVLDLGPRPFTLGHEIGALHEGRPVAIQPFAFCGRCTNCTMGNQNLCSPGTRSLHGMRADGGLADRLLVDPTCIVELPAGVSVEDACLVEPIAVAVHATNRVDLAPGMRVAVVGGGTVGLLSGAIARLHGVDVDIAVRHDHQREAAERLGLGRDVLGRYDVVFDAAGTDSSVAQAIDLVRSGSTVVIPGIYWGDVTMPGFTLLLKEVTLRPALYWGQHEGRRETDIAAEVLGRLPDLADAVITHRFPLDRAAEAFATAADRAAGAIKVVIEP